MERRRPTQWRPALSLHMRGKLSPKEIEVIVLVAEGFADKQVARSMGIKITTARTHIERIGRKTGCTRRADLTALAYELALI